MPISSRTDRIWPGQRLDLFCAFLHKEDNAACFEAKHARMSSNGPSEGSKNCYPRFANSVCLQTATAYFSYLQRCKPARARRRATGPYDFTWWQKSCRRQRSAVARTRHFLAIIHLVMKLFLQSHQVRVPSTVFSYVLAVLLSSLSQWPQTIMQLFL